MSNGDFRPPYGRHSYGGPFNNVLASFGLHVESGIDDPKVGFIGDYEPYQVKLRRVLKGLEDIFTKVVIVYRAN